MPDLDGFRAGAMISASTRASSRWRSSFVAEIQVTDLDLLRAMRRARSITCRFCVSFPILFAPPVRVFAGFTQTSSFETLKAELEHRCCRADGSELAHANADLDQRVEGRNRPEREGPPCPGARDEQSGKPSASDRRVAHDFNNLLMAVSANLENWCARSAETTPRSVG